MPAVQGMLSPDSARRPAPARPANKGTKRSASAASLLTPPRTTHKRTRAASKKPAAAAGSDSEHESEAELPQLASVDYEVDLAPGERVHVRKRRKTHVSSGLDAVAESIAEEDAFWAGASSSTSDPATARKPAATRTPVSTRTTRGKAPVSPPPSRRQTTASTEVAVPVTPPPTQRRYKLRPRNPGPKRDSPNNPFLVDGLFDVADEEDSPEANEPVTPENPGEAPTITYVFRGQKRVFQNPYYGIDVAEMEARAALDPEHLDFEPSLALPRKLLFPDAHAKAKARRRLPPPARSDLTPPPVATRTRARAQQDFRTPSPPPSPQSRKMPRARDAAARLKAGASRQCTPNDGTDEDIRGSMLLATVKGGGRCMTPVQQQATRS